MTATLRAPVMIGPALALEYRSVLVPVLPGHESEEALAAACRLAAERGSSIVAVYVLELPLEVPLDAYVPGEVALADQLLDEARGIGDRYGVRVIGRIVRARNAGRAIVEEARRRNSEIIVMGAPRKDRRRGPVFGRTVDYVLKHAHCRVLVGASRKVA